jgi:hypothetical protein
LANPVPANGRMMIVKLANAGKIHSTSLDKFDKGKLTYKIAVTNETFHVDHISPVAFHWDQKGGRNSGDKSRWDAATDTDNLELLTEEANLAKSSGGYHFSDKPYVLRDFKSIYAEGGIDNARLIDGKPFTEDEAGTKPV